MPHSNGPKLRARLCNLPPRCHSFLDIRSRLSLLLAGQAIMVTLLLLEHSRDGNLTLCSPFLVLFLLLAACQLSSPPFGLPLHDVLGEDPMTFLFKMTPFFHLLNGTSLVLASGALGLLFSSQTKFHENKDFCWWNMWLNWAWCFTPVTLALWWLRQKDHKFEANLGYIDSKQKQRKTENNVPDTQWELSKHLLSG